MNSNTKPTRICAEEGCGRAFYAKDVCQKHYQRLWNRAKGARPYHVGTFHERVFTRLEVGLCWEWQGARDAFGYGRMTYQGRNQRVHRLVWIHLVGPVADGMELDHLCRNKSCANPDHLEPVTHAENMRRSTATQAMHRVRWKRAA